MADNPSSSFLTNFEERQTRTEEGLLHLTETVNSFVKESRLERTDTHRRIDAIASNNRITWPFILSCIGTIIAVFSVAGVLHKQSLDPLYIATSALNNKIDTHVSLPGHQGTRIQFSKLDKEVENLDDKLQIEIAHVKELVDKLEERFEKHTAEANHPHGVLLNLERLRGELREIKGKVGGLSSVDKGTKDED